MVLSLFCIQCCMHQHIEIILDLMQILTKTIIVRVWTWRMSCKYVKVRPGTINRSNMQGKARQGKALVCVCVCVSLIQTAIKFTTTRLHWYATRLPLWIGCLFTHEITLGQNQITETLWFCLFNRLANKHAKIVFVVVFCYCGYENSKQCGMLMIN